MDGLTDSIEDSAVNIGEVRGNGFRHVVMAVDVCSDTCHLTEIEAQ